MDQWPIKCNDAMESMGQWPLPGHITLPRWPTITLKMRTLKWEKKNGPCRQFWQSWSSGPTASPHPKQRYQWNPSILVPSVPSPPPEAGPPASGVRTEGCLSRKGVRGIPHLSFLSWEAQAPRAGTDRNKSLREKSFQAVQVSGSVLALIRMCVCVCTQARADISMHTHVLSKEEINSNGSMADKAHLTCSWLPSLAGKGNMNRKMPERVVGYVLPHRGKVAFSEEHTGALPGTVTQPSFCQDSREEAPVAMTSCLPTSDPTAACPRTFTLHTHIHTREPWFHL